MRIRLSLNQKFGLLLILVVASFLRLYNLDTLPPHLTSDEASLGYNAYSILKTGKDEYGEPFPIVFKSFGDYKPGLYVYTAIPFIALFQLNELSVRLPGALSGIIAVYLLYLILKKLSQSKENQNLATVWPLMGAFVLAISPWHIHFSRGAWEISLALTLTLAGTYFFLLSLEKQKYLLISALFFGLTLLTYQGAKLSSGIVVLILAIIYFKNVIRFRRYILIGAMVIGLIISAPILLSFGTGQTGRLTVFSVFSYPRPEKYLADFLIQGNEKVGEVPYYLYHTEVLNFKRGVLGRYFNHFSGRFLFFEGDWQNPRHSPPNMGVLYLVDIFGFLFGIYALSKNKLTKDKVLILLWLLLAPLPSALSRDQVHAVRSFNTVIPFVLLISYGLSNLIITKKKLAKLFFVSICVLYLLNIVYYLDAYFIHLSKHQSKYWQYGYKQIVETVTPIQNNYSQITVQQSYAQPYIYFLFYQKYDPRKYQLQAKLKESQLGDVGQIEKLDNICFCAIDWSRNRGDKGTIIIGDTLRIPPLDSPEGKEFHIVNEIKYLDNETAFRVIEIK